MSSSPERAVWALDAEVLGDYVAGQRWFGSKARERVGAHVVDTAVLRDQVPGLVLALLAVRFQPGTHELYQLPLGLRPRAEGWADVSIGDAGGYTAYDGLADPALARELVHLIRAGKSLPAGRGHGGVRTPRRASRRSGASSAALGWSGPSSRTARSSSTTS